MAEFRIATRTEATTGHVVYQLWERLGGGAEDILMGEFETRDAAEAAMNQAVAPPDREPQPGLGTTDSEPAVFDDYVEE